MNKTEFWSRVSKLSVAVCLAVVAARIFFSKYLENVVIPIMLVGSIAFVVFVISEGMKTITSGRRKES